MIVVPEGPRCSKCREMVSVAVQFWAVSGEHGAAYPDSRGSKRSIRLCGDCLASLSDEMQEHVRPVARASRARKKA